MTSPQYRTVGRSTTRSTPPGKTIPVMQPDDTDYLCSKVSFCNCFAKLSVGGQFLKQRCVTNSIRADCDAKQQIFKYKGEVGYNMRFNPPRPLMSDKDPTRPSAFPLGAAMREGVFKKDDFESGPQQGLLRIPDVIIVNDKFNLSLEQTNIDMVVEVKFPPDKWGVNQERDYQIIAGGEDRLKLLTADDGKLRNPPEKNEHRCKCEPCKDRERQPVPVPLPAERTAEDYTNKLARIRAYNDMGRKHPIPVLYPPAKEPTPLSTYLLGGGLLLGGAAIAVVFSATGVGAVAGGLMARRGVQLLIGAAAVSTASAATANDKP